MGSIASYGKVYNEIKFWSVVKNMFKSDERVLLAYSNLSIREPYSNNMKTIKKKVIKSLEYPRAYLDHSSLNSNIHILRYLWADWSSSLFMFYCKCNMVK